jgi:hypothetical protein
VTEELTLDGLITQLRKIRLEHPSLGDAVITGPGCDACTWRASPLGDVRIEEYSGEPSIHIEGA